MLRNLKIVHTLFFMLLLTFSACDKDKDQPEEEEEPTPKQALYLKVNHLFDGNAMALNQAYNDDFGNKINFTRTTFYFSLPKIKNTSSKTLALDNNYYLVRFETDKSVMIDDMSSEFTIDNISGFIGVDSVTNHKDPSLYAADHPLAFQSPSQHWGWADGYLFVTIEGNVDTNGDNTFDDTFTFHIGLDSYLKEIKSLSGLNKSIGKNEASYINLNVDYKDMFSGIDLSVENSTHTMDNPDLATKFINNFDIAFELK